MFTLGLYYLIYREISASLVASRDSLLSSIGTVTFFIMVFYYQWPTYVRTRNLFPWVQQHIYCFSNHPFSGVFVQPLEKGTSYQPLFYVFIAILRLIHPDHILQCIIHLQLTLWSIDPVLSTLIYLNMSSFFLAIFLLSPFPTSHSSIYLAFRSSTCELITNRCLSRDK